MSKVILAYATNIEFIKYILGCIDTWSIRSKALMRSYLIYKLNKKHGVEKQIEDPNMVDI